MRSMGNSNFMKYTSNSGSFGKDLFLRLFSETYGAEKEEIFRISDDAPGRYYNYFCKA